MQIIHFYVCFIGLNKIFEIYNLSEIYFLSLKHVD